MTDEKVIAALDDAAHDRIVNLFNVLCDESISQNGQRRATALSRFAAGLKEIRSAHAAASAATDERETS